MVEVKLAAVLYSFCAMFTLGLCNFLLAYNQKLGMQPVTSIAFFWLMSGALGFAWVLSTTAAGKDGTPTFIYANAPEGCNGDGNTEALLTPVPAPGGFACQRDRRNAICQVVMCGLFSCAGAFFVRQTFVTDPVDSGPLSSLVATDVIITTLTCHFFLQEHLTARQWVAVGVVFVGMMVMCYPTHAAPTVPVAGTERGPVSTFFNALAFAFCASLSFVGCNVCVKLAFKRRMSPSSVNFIRFATVFVCGVVALGVALATEKWSLVFSNDAALQWFVLTLAALANTAGTAFLNAALTFACTGISLSIIGANSVVILLLTAVLEHLVPNTSRLVGMGVLISGVASMSLMAQ